MDSKSPNELPHSKAAAAAAVSNIKRSTSFKRPQSKIEIKSVSKNNNNQQVETKLNVRFEDNQKLPTHTSKTPKISLLSQLFTSLQPKRNQKTNLLNLLNWPLDDESIKEETNRNEIASTLNDYYARYINDASLEDNQLSKQTHLRSVNPIQSALIELINKKINENKRHSTSAALCEKSMKATSFVNKDLVGKTNKISDSFSISRLHNTTIAFSIPKQLSLNKKSKPKQQQPTTSSSIVQNQHDLNLFNGDQLSELAVGITDHEVKHMFDMFDKNGFNFNFDLIPNDFSLEQIEAVSLPQPPQLPQPPPPPPPQTPPTPRIDLDKTQDDKILIESERIDKIRISFTTLLLNCLIRISLFDVNQISYLQKQYDKFVATDSHIANQQKELNSKKNKIIRFLNNFLSDHSNLVPDLSSEQLRINFIYITILDLVKKQPLGYLTSLLDYMEYMEKYNKHFNQLVTSQDSYDFMFSFSTEIKLFLYDLMQELSLKQIEINPMTKDSITSLVTPIRINIFHQSDQKLNDPRSQVTASKKDTDLKHIDPTIFKSLFNDIPFAKEYPFDESYYRKMKYKNKSFEFEKEFVDNKELSLIAPPTPRFKIDSFSCDNSNASLLVPNIDLFNKNEQIVKIPTDLTEMPRLNEQEPVTRRAELVRELI